MSVSRRVIKNFASLSAAELISRFLGNLLSLFVARHLGDTVFGQFAFAIAFVSFFSLFADFGLTTLGIREIAKDRQQTNSLVTNIEVLQIVLAVGLLGLLVIIALMLPVDWRMKWLVIFFGLGMLPQAFNIAFVFQAHERMEWAAAAKVISQFAYLLGGFAIVIWTRDIFWLPVVLVLTSFLGVIVSLWGARRVLAYAIEGFSWLTVRQLVRRAAPFVISALAVQIYYNLDSVMLKFWYGDAVVGQYNAAYKISLLMIMLGGMMVGAIFPLLSASFQTNRAVFDRAIREWSRVNGLLAWPIAVGGVLLAQPILLLIYNRPEYTAATTAFQFLIILPFIIFWNSLYGQSLVAIGCGRLTMYGLVAGAMVNVAANVVLIPRYSLNGAAVATVIAELVVLAYLAVMYYRHLEVPIAQQFLVRPSIAAVGMGIVLWLVRGRWPVVSLVILGAVVYSGLVVVLGGLQKSDLQFIFRREERLDA